MSTYRKQTTKKRVQKKKHRKMRKKIQKRLYGGAALVLAGACAAGVFWQGSLSAAASAAMMPGIETIVSENTAEKPFRILELVDNSEDAQIGWLINGQEPYIKLYTYTYTDAEGNARTVHFDSLEEGLRLLPEDQRKAFAMNVRLDADGQIDENASTGISTVDRTQTGEEEAPLSYTDYQETYFLTDDQNADDWKELALTDAEGNSRVDTVQVNGSYVENLSGTGNYRKQEQQYYPIRENVAADKAQTGKYRENIQNFSYIEDETDRAAYFVTFAEVPNDQVNAALEGDAQTILNEYDYANGKYGYYENVYTALTDELAQQLKAGNYSFPGENPDAAGIADSALLVQDNSDGNSDGTASEVSQSNPQIYWGESIDSYPYYKYHAVGSLSDVIAKAEAAAADPDAQRVKGDITKEEDQYWYWYPDADGVLEQLELNVVAGRQPVDYTHVQNISDAVEDNYYYRVEKVWFCCQPGDNAATDPTSYSYYGWYYPSYPDGEDMYLPAGDKPATHYASSSEFALTPGSGDYDFVPGGDTAAVVQVDHLYYQGGYENHDWMKRYVFHLTPSDNTTGSGTTGNGTAGDDATGDSGSNTGTSGETFDDFQMEVDTRLATDLTKKVYAGANGGAGTGSDGTTGAGSTGSGAGSVFEDAGDLNLSDYSLIYVNGTLSAETAQAILDSEVACIVNADRTQPEEFQAIFDGFIKPGDADNNYVTQYVYFFHDGNAGEGVISSLVNKAFYQTFTEDEAMGFEEITKYISQENRYRELGDGTEKLDPLSDELSQARALEYIINYQYKRNRITKDSIRVLEIMPDANCGQLNVKTVQSWLEGDNPAIKEITACCYQPENGLEYLTDGDKNTFWHSRWTNPEPRDTQHYLDITFEAPADVDGFVYTPRQYNGSAGSKNGLMRGYRAEFYDAKGNKVAKDITEDSVTDSTDNTVFNTDGDRSTKKLYFGKTVSNVTRMRIVFTNTLANDKNNWHQFAAASEIGVIYAGSNTTAEVTIDTMTASEFVGHKEDILAKYDMIYIGDGRKSNSDPRIVGAGNLCYTHIGTGIKVEEVPKSNYWPLPDSDSFPASYQYLKLLGQLDTEYDTSWQGENGMRRFAPISTYSENGGGYFRGSGNDMTSVQKDELLEFVKSGYPVILGSSLTTGTKVNTERVDSASYYYEFLTEAVKYDNVVNQSALDAGTKNIFFFANLSKPVIQFTEKPKDPPRTDETPGEDSGYVSGELKYVFTIGNDSDAAPATTTYDCNLYLDLNFDGNLSQKESQKKYIVIQDADGVVVSPVEDEDGNTHYELRAGRSYTLTRKLPDDYFKLITWKLEITSNRNSYVHTSEIGYAKQKNTGDKQIINVLQLAPDSRNVWDLTDTNGTFYKLIGQLEDFDIRVSKITVSDVKTYTRQKMEDELKDKQILVIGFCDVYPDIDNSNGQVYAILDFIRSGKSVIFSNDTTSYINYDSGSKVDEKMYKKIATTAYGVDENTGIYYDQYLHTAKISNPTWGLSLNTILRSVLGMDRYGITSDAELDGQTISSLLKKGQALTDGDSVSFEELKQAAGDIAYQTGGDRTTSYAQTQGYNNNLVEGVKMGKDANSNVTRATKVNDGAVTQYPYRMGDSLALATTHGEYYQLALEQDLDINGNSDGETDVVVWYCLADGVYGKSPNDARNNYYFYSKGNVTYTGAGLSKIPDGDEMKLFINAIVAAANVTAVEPAVNFVDYLSPKADVESSRYYATDQTAWTEDEGNVLEQDMDFYIDVRDYNMISMDLSQEDLDKQEMTISFYIQDENGELIDDAPEDNAGQPLTDITAQIEQLTGYDGSTVTLGDDGTFHINQSNAFQLTVPSIEQYLRQGTNSYKNNCRLYVKVTSTVYLYGQPRTSTSWAGIDLRQRQLFDMN